MNYSRLNVIRESEDVVLYRGADPASAERYTVKELKGSARGAPAQVARLRCEFDLLNRLPPEHLLRPVRDHSEVGVLLFEDTRGSVGQLIDKYGPLAPGVVVRVLLEALGALGHLHGQGLGHGSLNPHKLLVDPHGRVKLGDFLPYPFAGTVPLVDPGQQYQAPEVLDSGLGACQPSSDLYLLGFAALEMLVGPTFVYLFGATTSPEQRPDLLSWHADPGKGLTGLREALAEAPNRLVSVIERLICKEVSKRVYRDAAQVVADLKRCGLALDQRLPPFDVPPGPARRATPRGKAQGAQRRPARCLLELTDLQQGPGAVRYFSPGGPVLVGRQPGCDLVLAGGDVSAKHALLTCEQDGWHAYDLNSRGGTLVNDAPVRHARLGPGDTLTIGCHYYELNLREAGKRIGP